MDCREAFKAAPALLRQIKDMKNQIDKLKQEIDDLKSHERPFTDMESVYYEMNERIKRSTNFMLYNVPESQSRNLQERIADDRREVTNILTEINAEVPELDLKNIIRVGKSNGGKPRPLKVVTTNAQYIKRILHLKNMIRNSIWKIGADQTLIQRNLLKETKEKLKTRLDAGEKDLTIKFVNGVPKIIIQKPNANAKN